MDTKRSYEAPRLVAEGSVKDLTLGNTDGDFTDMDFPDNTPKDELTFS